MTKRFLITIGIMGTLSVILGAVGVHILNGNLSEENILLFNIANEYLMVHALALLGLIALKRYISSSYINTIYYFFVIGILLFSGTMGIGSLVEITEFDTSSIRFLTPIGGTFLVAGWITIIFAGISYQHKKSGHH